MRIIAGEFRGRKLLPPAGDATRPITDRAKQSLFDVLSPRIESAIVLDLFAGTGSMGLECLSRGAARAEFYEADRSAIERLKKNIAVLGVDNRAIVHAGDLFKRFGRTGANANLIFIDPPYRFLTERESDLQKLVDELTKRMTSDGLVIFRHDLKDELQLKSLRAIDRRTYGSMIIELLVKQDDSSH